MKKIRVSKQLLSALAAILLTLTAANGEPLKPAKPSRAEKPGATAAAPKAPRESRAEESSPEVLRARAMFETGRVLRVLGGVDSGGGNTFPAGQLSAKDLREFVKDAHRELPLLLNKLEVGLPYAEITNTSGEAAQFVQMISAIIKRVFPENSRDIFVIHREARYRFQTNGSCRDRAGNEVDASVYGVAENEICLSQNRLLRKLSWGNAATQLPALLAHELSHKLGTNEQEAETIQFMILGMTQYQAVTSFSELTEPALNALNELENTVQNTMGILQAPTKDLDMEPLFKMVEAQFPNAPIIKALVEYARSMTKLLPDLRAGNLQTQLVLLSRDAVRAFDLLTNMNPHSLLRKSDFDKAIALTYKVAPMSGYFPQQFGPDRDYLEKVFGGRDWITVREYADPSSHSIVNISERVYRVRPGDKASFLYALQDLEDTITALKSAVGKYHKPVRQGQ